MTYLPNVSKNGIVMVKGGRNAPLQVKLGLEEREAVKALAARRGLTASEYVRALINIDAKGGVDWSRADERVKALASRLPNDKPPAVKPRGSVKPSNRKRKAAVAAAPPKGVV